MGSHHAPHQDLKLLLPGLVPMPGMLVLNNSESTESLTAIVKIRFQFNDLTIPLSRPEKQANIPAGADEARLFPDNRTLQPQGPEVADWRLKKAIQLPEC